MAAPPSNSLCRCSCQCPISTLKTITILPEGGHSAESAAKSGRLPVTVRGGMLRRRIRDEREKGRGGEQKEWMNHFKNGNLMTDKLLINLADTASVCVCTCTFGCAVYLSPVFERIQH